MIVVVVVVTVVVVLRNGCAVQTPETLYPLLVNRNHYTGLIFWVLG